MTENQTMQNAVAPKKADVILKETRELAKQVKVLEQQVQLLQTMLGEVAQSAEKTATKSAQDYTFLLGQNSQIFEKVLEENASVKTEVKFLALQNEGIYTGVAEMFQKMEEKLNALQVPQTVATEAPAVEVDYDLLAEKVAEKVLQSLPAQESLSADYIASKVAEQIVIPEQAQTETVDYDLLADKMAEKIVLPETDGDAIANKVFAMVGAPQSVSIDEDALAEKVVAQIPAQEVISPDYIASKVAEQIVIPEQTATAVVDYDLLAEKVAEKITLPEADGDAIANKVFAMVGAPQSVSIDEDALVEKFVEQVPTQEVISADYIASKVAEQIVIPEQAQTEVVVDYDLLAEKVAEKIVLPQAEATDYDLLAEKVAEKVAIPTQEVAATCDTYDSDAIANRVLAGLVLPTTQVDEDALAEKMADKIAVQEIDYQTLANMIADSLPPQEVVSADYIASKVAEQIVLPEISVPEVATQEVDMDAIADKVCEKLAEQQVQVDDEGIANRVLAGLVLPTPAEIDEELLADRIADKLMKVDAVQINEDELADGISKKVGTILPDDFDLVVDDAGCDTLATALSEKMDYEQVAVTLAEKLQPYIVEASYNTPDYDEMAEKLSEKLNVSASINEDAIADKAAAVLSNYLPEMDADDISDKVAERVVPAIPVVDYTTIVDRITTDLKQSQEESDYDIVIDEEGLQQITDFVSTKIEGEMVEKYNTLQEELDEIKALLKTGVVVAGAAAVASVVEPQEEVVTVTEEVEPQEELITVSDLVEPQDELLTVSTVVEEESEVEEISEDLDEVPVAGEIMPDGIPGISNGVDFTSMMKYDRSFISRIIQGTDDVKAYYGETKTALLSYNKVNSNVAWSSERFNKGRETIARFKIRGKTLCLYLALNPADYKTSVYHHVDVSDNKSMHGTPMMVKIKSPLGVKKAIRLIDEMLAQRGGIKRNVPERDYVMMYPYETIEELIEDGLVKDVSKK